MTHAKADGTSMSVRTMDRSEINAFQGSVWLVEQAIDGTELDGRGFPFGNMVLAICLRALAGFKEQPTISERRLQALAIYANLTLSLVDLER